MKQILKHLESPFGFIKGFQLEHDVKSRAEMRAKEHEDHKEQNLTNWDLTPEMQVRLAAVEQKERVFEEKFDVVAEKVAQRVGYSSVPWFKLTWVLLWMYTVLTNLVLFFRKDFVNLTICITALYMMFNTERITRGRFRILVLGIFISCIYDIAWFYLKHAEYVDEGKSDSGMEKNIKKFSLMMSYASFILRVSC